MRLSIRRRERRAPSYGITTAESSHLDDIARRQRQYAFTMLFRIVAIIVVVFVPGLTVLERVILGLVATIIPYVAVIRANGGPPADSEPTNLMHGGPKQPELPGTERRLDAAPWAEAEEFGDAAAHERDPDGDEGEDRAEDGDVAGECAGDADRAQATDRPGR